MFGSVSDSSLSSLHFSVSVGPSSAVMSPTGILTCCMIPSEVVPFLFLASVCRSLQCLISALTQVGGGGLLFRFACSAVLRGGRGTADKCHWHMQGALAGFQPHWASLAQECVLSPSTLLRLPAALYGAGPAVRAVPVFGYSTEARTRLGLRLLPSPTGAAQAARSMTGVLSPGAVHLIPSAVPASVSVLQLGASALCLFSGAGL